LCTTDTISLHDQVNSGDYTISTITFCVIVEDINHATHQLHVNNIGDVQITTSNLSYSVKEFAIGILFAPTRHGKNSQRTIFLVRHRHTPQETSITQNRKLIHTL